MPRIAGQIDLAKSEAILEAASELFVTKGPSASLEEIARRAGVSKQTIYNHYGSKAELLRALIGAKVEALTAPLAMPGAADNPVAALTGLARDLLQSVLSRRSDSFTRLIVQGAIELPDLANTFYEAGPRTSRARLAQFLARETAAGRLTVDDPKMAAEFFFGMVIGSHQLRGLLGVKETLGAAEIHRIAHAAAARFLRAYAP